MSWYYSNEGQQVGPITDAAWEALIQSGKISATTMVWRDGMPAWKPFREVEGTAGALTATLPAGVCSQCGTQVPADELIVLDGKPVCASCKPAALQKLKEGVALNSSHIYGGFWIRFVAKVIDGIILVVVQMLISMGLFAAISAFKNPQQVSGFAQAVPSLIGLVVGAIYITFFLGKFGATPGKMVCGLKVIRPDGSPLTFGRAFGRWGAELLNAFTFTIGYLIAAFDSEKRALHDRVADTRVIKS